MSPVSASKKDGGFLIRDPKFYKRLFMLALPMAGQSVLTFGVGLADNIMVGSLSDLSLSAVYMANQWMTLLQQFILGFSSATMVLATQYWGKKDTESIKTIVATTAKFAFLTGLLFFVIAFFFPRQLLGLYTSSQPVMEEAEPYLRVVSFSYLFFAATEVLIASMKCVETVRVTLYTSFSTLLINVLFNYLLIFGRLGFPALGVRGAAYATLLARVAEFGIMLYFVARKDTKLRLRPRDLARYSKVLLKDYIHYGIPIFMGAVVWGANMTGQGAIIGRLGQHAISAVSIANNLFSLLSVAVYSVSAATAIIIGKTVGSGDYELVKKYAKTLQLVFIGMGLITSVIIYLSRFAIPLMYPSIEEDTKTIVYQLITVLSLMIIGTAYQMSGLTGIVRAGGCTHFVFVNDTIFVFLVVLPLGYLAAFHLNAPVTLVYAALKCDQWLKCIVAVIKINRFKWIKNITRGEGET